MSLINDMLKDLEKRHAEDVYPKGVVLAGIGVQAPGGRPHVQWLFYLGGILAAAILVIVFKDSFFPPPAFQETATVSQTTQPLPLPLNEHPTAETDTQSPPDMVASVELPEDGGVSTSPVPLDHTAPERTDMQAGKVEMPAPSMDSDKSGAKSASVKSEDKVAHVTATNHSTAKANAGPAMPGVSHPVVAKALDHDDDRSPPATQEAAQAADKDATDKNTVTAAEHPNTGVTVQLKKRIHPLTVRERARQLRGEALRLARRGELDQAEDELSKALSLEPRHVAARGALAGLMIQNGQLAEAAALLDRGLELKPGSATLIELRARIYVMQGDNQSARKLLEENAPKVSQDLEYHAMLAAVYQRLGDYDKAGAVYQALVNEKPQNGVWWLGLGLSMEATGKVEEARQAYQKAEVSRVLSPKLRQFVKQKLSSLS